jgi:hypothetical protein
MDMAFFRTIEGKIRWDRIRNEISGGELQNLLI